MRAPKQITARQALTKLQDLCARAEHSEGEIREKLYRWRISSEDANKIVQSMIAERYIDDERFARSYVNDKVMFARWGKRKIYAGLLRKRIDRATIDTAIGNIDNEIYTDNLRHIAMHKIKASPEMLDTYEQRTKLYRHLLSRGYEPQLTAQVLREIITRNRD